MIRFRLGMFDPPSMVKYAQVADTELEAPSHKAHALKMAQQSIVLLKNGNNTLPLSKKIKKIAVVGPNADNKIAVLGNYNGTPSHVVTLLEGIKNKLGKDVNVVYEKAINFTNDTLMVHANISKDYTMDGDYGVRAEYYNNEKLEGEPALVRMEKDIDHYWAEGQNPAPGIGTIHYSARFSTYLTATEDQKMHFEIEGDDGYRLFVDDSLLINAWTRNRWGAKQFSLDVKNNTRYKIVVEFYQNEGNAVIRLKSGKYVKTDMAALAQRLQDADIILFAGGISPQLEGEEMPVNFPGFNGGDRTSIVLPAVQTELMQSLQKTGKPVVFVMMTGSAIAIPTENEKIPAIINAWYGGQSAGTAIADVLFGDYNPGGRLPVTFYKNDSDLPAFSDYSMNNRTYRYFKGEALYPFGYGLSYTQFRYDQLQVTATANKSARVSVRITNTGKRAGEEVTQLYLTYPQQANRKTPIRALKGFRRLNLKAGESRTIQFNLTAEDLSLVAENGQLNTASGTLVVHVGGGQPGLSIKTSSNNISANLVLR